MTPEESRKIAKQVTEELRKANAEFTQIQRQIFEIVRGAPIGLPLPDGQLRIVQAGRAAQLAFEARLR